MIVLSDIIRWNAGLLLFIVALAVVYVLQISSATMQGYALRDLEVSVGELQVQSEELQMAVTSAKSLVAVTQRMQILGFVEPAQVVYVNVSSGVAKR